jgi:hypothetical protein
MPVKERGPGWAASLGLLLVTAGCAAVGGDEAGPSRTCQEALRADEAKIRTDRWDPPKDLPGLGDYPEIHWQVRAKGNPCSRGPGPTEWAYQGVVTLRPEDARTMAQRYAFVPYDSVDPAEFPDSGPADTWPGLVPFLPAEPRWRYSRIYNESEPSTRWRVAFLDVERGILLFRLDDH